jgi:hypothetical protein
VATGLPGPVLPVWVAALMPDFVADALTTAQINTTTFQLRY